MTNLGLSKRGSLPRAREGEAVVRAAAVRDLACPSYLVGSLEYERDLVTEPLRLEDGHVAVPSGSGPGVVGDEEALPTLDAGRA